MSEPRDGIDSSCGPEADRVTELEYDLAQCRAALASHPQPVSEEIVCWYVQGERMVVWTEADKRFVESRGDTTIALVARSQPVSEEGGAVAAVCGWTDNSGEGDWDTGCGNCFTLNDGTPEENGMHFCCYCGKPLESEAPPVGTNLFTADEARQMLKHALAAHPPRQSAGVSEETLRTLCEAVNTSVRDYLDDYEVRGDEGCYTPNERERFLLADAINGLLVDEDFIRALHAHRDAVRYWSPEDRFRTGGSHG